MAMCATNLLKNNVSRLGRRVINQFLLNINRQLYAPSALGIDKYINVRNQVKTAFLNVDEIFRKKMYEFVEPGSNNMIFTEDLKTMLHLVQKVPADLDLLMKMIKKFNSQDELRFGSFIFGPVVMRAFYHLDEPDLALAAFKDPTMKEFFGQLMSYQILLDLLYNHGRYKEVREVYDIIRNNNLDSVTVPKNSVIITIAACYKEDTEESLQYALQVWKDYLKKGDTVLRRALIFLGALALNQGAPQIALEIISGNKSNYYIDIRCIKLAANLELGRLDEVAVLLRSSLKNDNPSMRKQKYFKDIFAKIDTLIRKENLDENSELVKLTEQLKLHDFVQDGTLEDHINLPIENRIMNYPPGNRNYTDSSNYSQYRPQNNRQDPYQKQYRPNEGRRYYQNS